MLESVSEFLLGEVYAAENSQFIFSSAIGELAIVKKILW